MARSFSQEARSDSQKIGEMRYRMSHLLSTTAIARTFVIAGVLLAVLFLASQSFFPAFAQEGPIMHDEKDDSQVAAFAATDEDGDDITWSLAEDGGDISSPDRDDFDISQDGVLTFKNTPNYEAPTGTGDNRQEQNSYTVVVVAKDDYDMPAMDTETVTVMVKNIDEPGMIELSTLQPKEGRAITATLTDPDEQRDTADDADDTIISDDDSVTPRRHAWQWARCSTTDVATCVDIEENSTSTSYTATSTDRGHYLRVTAKYADKQTPDPEPGEDLDLNKTAHGMSAHPVVRSDYVPEPPLFPGQDEELSSDSNSRDTAATTSRDIAENSAAGTAVGAPVRAMDEGFDGNQEVLTYTLSGADASFYRIDSSSGQLRVGPNVALDHETNEPNTDTVTVRATDPTDRYSEVTVTINITDVDEDPSITDRSSSQTSIVRQESDTELTVGADHAATDPEDANDSLTWSVTGADRGRFDISDAGQVTFLEVPNFEAPADSGRNNVYDFNVVVTDSGDNTDSLPVTVTINNTEEVGTLVVLFNGLTPDTPVQTARVGTTIRAKLTDPDGVSNVRYEWQQGGTPIDGATSASYRPATTTGGSLTVEVTYNDPLADDITLESTPLTVTDRQADNDQPEIEEPGTNPTVAEDSPGDLTTSLSVVDDGDDTHSWAITGGRDRSLFTINQTNGTLSLMSGVELDHENKPTLQVTLRATDPSAASDSFTLTVDVTNVEEDPEITSSPESPVSYREDQTGPVGTFTATDDEDDSARPRLPLTWSVNSNIFSIDNRGVLKFVSQPDFELLASNIQQDGYTIIVTVADNTIGGGRTDTESLTINVINVDEAGEVTLDALAPKDGVELTASLTDPDGTIASERWTWSNSTSRTGPWATTTADAATTTRNQETADYTPNEDDVGKYLRALVTYTDAQSSVNTPPTAKTASIVSTNVVRDVDYANTAPIFPGQEMDDTLAGMSRPITANATTSREIVENSAAGTRVGAAVSAVDLDESRQQQVLTYTIGDSTITGAQPADDDLFSIGRATGQITVAADDTLDYEHETNTDDLYIVLVTATDPSGLTSSIDVTIMVTDEKEAPEIADAMGDDNVASTSTAENTADNTATTTVLSTYTATDDEDEDDPLLKWTLSGADADIFSLCAGDTAACADPTINTVSLRFKQATDYEDPADSGRNNVYDVIVTATDSDMMTDSRSVAVTVTNAEEAGTVTLSNRQPEVDVAITATLSDLDGGETGVTWKWEFSESGESACDDNIPELEWSDLRAANSATYTPVEDDATRCLRATATYTDRATDVDNPITTDVDESKQKDSQPQVSDFPVQAKPATNATPQFSDQDPDVAGKQTVRYIEENSDEGVAALEDGTNTLPDDDTDPDRVTATDADMAITGANPVAADVLTYSLSGSDERSFEIDRATGQISVKEGTELNYETKDTYTVVVTATDSSLASDSITVTINVVDMNEAPVIMERGLNVSGPARLTHEEEQPASTVVASYSATGPDATGARLTLEGVDANLFTLSPSSGELTFNTSPNFESPADQGGDNNYSLIVRAAMGSLADTQNVTVTVENVDEDGEVRFTSTPLVVRVGVELEAELDEADDETNVTWQWASGGSATGPWSPIGGATNATYTPLANDVGDYLQVTASYTDASFRQRLPERGDAGRGRARKHRRDTRLPRAVAHDTANVW